MISIERTLDVARPADEVFALVADQTNAPCWQGGLDKVTRIGDLPLGVGTEHEFHRRFAGRVIKSRSRFVEYDEGRHVAFEFDDGSIAGRGSYDVASLPDGSTRLVSHLEMRPSGLLRFFEPLLRRILIRDIDRDDRRLKLLLESTGD
ncbi:SRPBCC family protein [Nocardia sp. NPDC058640]|uniref:SRPBCC family protein n=1 Tax=Nocardia sp. NPDC058640 TaxID=3346571 RepID=UPI003648B8A3